MWLCVQDDKKSSTGNSESKEEGRMDSFDSEEPASPAQPDPNVYAKSNIVKGWLCQAEWAKA